MSQLVEKIKNLNLHKDMIIKDIREIKSTGSNTQARNLQEYAAKTDSIEEILLYIDYQCARDKKMLTQGRELKNLVEKYKDKGIDVIRYLLGIFARYVLIQTKAQGAKNE
jgi:CO dehydrogenase/acetyl-CoA synthase gamma subunit (corrinoid Fe-S protein)